MIDVSRFKVVYGEKVLDALAIYNLEMSKKEYDSDGRRKHSIAKYNFLEVIAINEDGHVVSICDEAWMFQFLPIVKG